MTTDKTNPKYLGNPKLHLRDLYRFYDHLSYKLLGEADDQWRRELKFVRDRTQIKIQEVKSQIYLDELVSTVPPEDLPE